MEGRSSEFGVRGSGFGVGAGFPRPGFPAQVSPPRFPRPGFLARVSPPGIMEFIYMLLKSKVWFQSCFTLI